MAPPRAAAQSELLMAATQSRLIANPSLSLSLKSLSLSLISA